MSWDQLVAAIKEFFNQPVVVIVTSIASTVVGAITIISKTSFGKRAIHSMKKRIAEILETVHSSNEKINDVEKLARERIESLKAEYEIKTKVLASQFDFFLTSVFKIIELYPNVKIQNAILELKAEYENKKEEIEKVIGWAYEDVEKYITKKQSELESYIAQVRELTLTLENKIKEVDVSEEQREEEPHTDSAEEKIQSNI